MSLSYDDLQAIRRVVEETVSPIKGELEALGNDIKEIYEMISSSQTELVEAAKQAGVRLPSH